MHYRKGFKYGESNCAKNALNEKRVIVLLLLSLNERRPRISEEITYAMRKTLVFVVEFFEQEKYQFRKIIFQLRSRRIWILLFIILLVIDKTSRSERENIGDEGKLLDVVTVIMLTGCAQHYLDCLNSDSYDFDEMIDSTSGENQYVRKTKINLIQKCVHWMNNARKLTQIYSINNKSI